MSTVVKIFLTIGALFAATIIQLIIITPVTTYILKGGSLEGVWHVVIWLVIFGILMFLIWKKK